MASKDRDALVALFCSTGGAGWTRRDNWNTDADRATWFGVKVNDQGRVVDVDLGSNNLQGPIPKELGALAKLASLCLRCNKLTGGIPEDLGNLTALTKLWLTKTAWKDTSPRS
ncbi:unnamed protein product [Ectocarpus sp. CCAP 1310/34]|nr:unnamed protein product [Ectocarpus sp. CCAP 1310/34]